MSTYDLPANAGYDNFDDSGKLFAPYRKLAQAQSRPKDMPDVPAGEYYDEKAKKNYGAKMDVVLLEVKQNRVLFFGQGVKGKKCWSDDAKVPSPKVEHPQHPTCAGCEHEKSDLHFKVLCLDVTESLERDEPVVFTYDAKSTHLGPVRMYVRAVKAQHRPLGAFKVTMGSMGDKNEKGKFQVPTFSEVKPITDENLKRLVFEAYSLYVQSGEAEQVEPDQPEEDIPF